MRGISDGGNSNQSLQGPAVAIYLDESPVTMIGDNLDVHVYDIERVEALSRLIGVEKSIYFQVDGHDKVFPICNEDLERETDVKTSAVHFMRFEFDQNMIADFVSGSDVKVGSAHPNYDYETSLDSQSQEALSEDFNS